MTLTRPAVRHDGSVWERAMQRRLGGRKKEQAHSRNRSGSRQAWDGLERQSNPKSLFFEGLQIIQSMEHRSESSCADTPRPHLANE